MIGKIGKPFSALGATLSAGFGLLGSLAAVSATAQVMPPQAMLNALGANCDRATEVTYQSQILASPDGNTLVRAEGLLRKRVNADSPLRAVDTDDYCYPDMRETVSRQITLQTSSGIRRLVDDPYNDGYIMYQPRAFSADSRFLALDMRVAFTEGDTGSYALFLDTSDDTIVDAPNLCEGFALQSNIGFTSSTEAVVLCQSELRLSQQFESVNLLTGTVRSLTERPENAIGHGNVIRAFEVTKVQLFD